MAENLEGLFNASMSGLKAMVDVNTIVGEPIKADDDTVIIPYSRVSFGYGMGGAETGALIGGSGGGVTVTPVGFLVISHGETKMINVDAQNPVEKLIDKFPDIVDSITGIFKK